MFQNEIINCSFWSNWMRGTGPPPNRSYVEVKNVVLFFYTLCSFEYVKVAGSTFSYDFWEIKKTVRSLMDK